MIELWSCTMYPLGHLFCQVCRQRAVAEKIKNEKRVREE